jgi:hypothetical protein
VELLSHIENQVAVVDAALKPFTHRPIMEVLENFEELRERNFLAEAGIEVEAVALLRTMLDLYEHGNEDTRAAIRGMFDRYGAFRSAVVLPWEPTVDSFRLHVLHLSARDLSDDPRDEVLTMQDFCQRAGNAGIEVAPIVREIAAISSDIDRYGMGSTRSLLNIFTRQ